MGFIFSRRREVKPITVLSLFDGISCGQVALQRAGIPVEKYYASEVDKYAIQITQKNFPNTIQLGDVKQVWARNLPKIDLLIGGSPCQDLSIAKNNRQGLNGRRSGLFWHYVRLLRTCKPKYFLLENVASMPKEAKDIISRETGVEPILINSALVSAQQRKRLYWTNIPNITQPIDKGILLKDILEKGFGVAVEKKGQEIAKTQDKSLALMVRDYKGFGNQQMTGVAEPIPCALRNRGNGKQPEFNGTNKANSLTTVQTDSMVCEPVKEPNRIGGFYGQVTRWGIYDEKAKSPTLTASMGMGGGFVPMVPERLGQIGSNSQANRIYSVRGKSVSLNANGGGMGAKTGLYKIDLPDGDYTIRKLTPVECERLQTLPDNYTAGISNTQRYKCLGNGWTVDVIAHIFSFIKEI